MVPDEASRDRARYTRTIWETAANRMTLRHDEVTRDVREYLGLSPAQAARMKRLTAGQREGYSSFHLALGNKLVPMNSYVSPLENRFVGTR